ncbi:TolC family protein [Spirochaeta dissipatitropha]
MLCASALLPFTAFADTAAPGSNRPAGEVLTLQQLVEVVLEGSADLRLAYLAREEARYGWQAARAGAGLQIELDADLVAYDSRRVETGAPAAVGLPALNVETLFSEPRIRASLALPADGRLNIELSGRFERSSSVAYESEDDPDISYSLKPSLNMQYSQPVFAGGRLLDFRSTEARDQLAASGYSAAAFSADNLQNQLTMAAVELYGAIHSLRQSRTVLQRRFELERSRVEQAETDLAAGAISEQQFLQLRVNLNRIRENILNVEENQQLVQRRIRDISGGLDISAYRTENFNAGTLMSLVSLSGTRNSPLSVQRAERALDEARWQQITSALGRASRLTVFGRLQPRYPIERENPEDIASSVSDLFDSAGFDWTLGIGLKIPLFDSGSKAAASAAEELAIEQRVISLQQAVSDSAEDVRNLGERIRVISERLELLELEITLNRQAYAEAALRFESGIGTEQQLTRLELDLIQSENNHIQAEHELALAWLELQLVYGE